MALKLTKAHNATIAAIKAGTLTRVKKTKETDELVSAGYIEVNTNDVNDDGALVRLTEAGSAAAPAVGTAETAPATAPVFSIVAQVALPSISRTGAGSRQSKYPLADIPEGGAIFIQAPEGKEPKNLSKQFGSMVSDFNKAHTDRYLTSRTIANGKEAGFGDQFDGKAGIGIYRRPVSERPAPKAKAAASE